MASAAPGASLGIPESRSPPGSAPVPFELSQGAVDRFPHARWSKLQSRVWASDVPDALYDPDIAGDRGLRSSIARMLLVSRGVECSAEDILIVPSTRTALALVGAVLRRSLSAAIVEDPGYGRGGEALAAVGAKIVPLAVDRDGLRTDLLPDGKPGSLLAYVTPAAQFPTGAVLSRERREALASWCLDGGRWLFEDDYDWDARFDGERPAVPLKAGAAGESIFYCQSLSRTLFSSLRMAALVVPRAFRERAIAAQDKFEAASSLPAQLVAREFIDNGDFAAHSRRLRLVYRERREAMVELVRPYLGSLFEAGLNAAGLRLVLRCPADQAARLAGRLRAEGIICSTLSDLSAQGVSDDGLVLGFAAFPVDAIRACAGRVARAFEK